MAITYGHWYARQLEDLASGPWLRGTRPLEAPEILSIQVRPQFQEEYLAPFVFTKGKYLSDASLDAQPATYTITGFDATLVVSAATSYSINAQPAVYTISAFSADLLREGGLWLQYGAQENAWTQQGAGTNGLWVDYPLQSNTWVDS